MRGSIGLYWDHLDLVLGLGSIARLGLSLVFLFQHDLANVAGFLTKSVPRPLFGDIVLVVKNDDVVG